MERPIEELLRQSPLFRGLTQEDRHRIAAVARVREFAKGEALFDEGDPSDLLYTVVVGRVKVFKTLPRGSDLILEIFGPGDPVGAVAVYQSRPYPASAVALDPAVCLVVPRREFFGLLETYPTLVRGLLVGLTHRLMELTTRLADLSGGHMDGRLARFFLKLADDSGERRGDGIFIPMPLSRQEIADLVGTTIETAIRIMSRWGKQGIVLTDKNGFTVIDRDALESIALT